MSNHQQVTNSGRAFADFSKETRLNKQELILFNTMLVQAYNDLKHYAMGKTPYGGDEYDKSITLNFWRMGDWKGFFRACGITHLINKAEPKIETLLKEAGCALISKKSKTYIETMEEPEIFKMIRRGEKLPVLPEDMFESIGEQECNLKEGCDKKQKEKTKKTVTPKTIKAAVGKKNTNSKTKPESIKRKTKKK